MADRLLLPLTPPGPILLPTLLDPPLPAPPRLASTAGAALAAAALVRIRWVLMRIVRELWSNPKRLATFLQTILHPRQGPATPANPRTLFSRGNSPGLRELVERALCRLGKGRAASIGVVALVLYAMAKAASPWKPDEEQAQPPAAGNLPLFVRRNLRVMAFQLVPRKRLPLLPNCRFNPVRSLRITDEKNQLKTKQAISCSAPKQNNMTMLTQAPSKDKAAATQDSKEEDKSDLVKTLKMADAQGSRKNIEQDDRTTSKSLASFIHTGSSSA